MSNKFQIMTHPSVFTNNEIEKFGKVVPVKNNYSERNSVSRNQSSPELSQHDIDSKTDDGLPQDQADPGSSARESRQDDGEVKMEKETAVKMGQGENRSRVFSNQKYRQNYRAFPPNHNQGRRYFRGRGNTGGGFRGGRFENYSFRQFGGTDMRHDYRQQHQQQYTQDKSEYYHGGSMDEKPSEASHTNDSNNAPPAFAPNPRDQHYRYARNQNRRPHRFPGQRVFNHQGPHRGLHKPPRANSETIASGGDGLGNSSNYEQASQEKKDMTNGY